MSQGTSSGAGPTRTRLAVTMGDVNGIGPEIVARALAADHVASICDPVIIGNARLLARYFAAAGIEADVTETTITLDRRTFALHSLPSDAALALGTIDAGAGRLAGDAIAHAVALALRGDADAIVTAPISKAALQLGGYAFPGHTEMLAALAGGDPLMVLATEGMRVALATIHVPLESVPASITDELVVRRARAFADSLTKDFGIDRPRIALLGLNPHAGEGGAIGSEEIEILLPALRTLRELGVAIDGPHPADAFFARYRTDAQDGVLALYHDQGLIPLKMFAHGHGVNITSGLPVVRTSPDHGTAFDLAGRGLADPASMIEAMIMAVAIVHERRRGSPH